MKSRISSFTDTIGFISPHSAVAAGAAGGGGAGFGEEHAAIASAPAHAAANTPRPAQREYRNMIMVSASVNRRRSLHKAQNARARCTLRRYSRPLSLDERSAAATSSTHAIRKKQPAARAAAIAIITASPIGLVSVSCH